MIDFPIWAAVGIFFGVLAGIPATILILAQGADNSTARRPHPPEPFPTPRQRTHGVRRTGRPLGPALPDQLSGPTWRVLEPTQPRAHGPQVRLTHEPDRQAHP